MFKLKKEEKMVMSKSLTPQKSMTTYVWCVMYGDVLNLQLG
jgi:hypothetical protein